MTKQGPLVSVITPAWNAEKFISEAVNSILSQTYTNLEVILIDDCSTDNTWDIIKKLGETDSRIKIFKNKTNLGIGASRNYGISLASGEFIAWQDADDASTPTRIQEQVDFMRKNPKVGVVGGYLDFFGKNIKPSTRKYDEHDEKLRKNIFRFNPVAQPVSMFRTECFERLGSYDPNYRVSEDLEMFFRIGTKYEFGNVQKSLLKYRQYSDSLTHKNLKNMEQTTLKLRNLYRKNPAYNPSPVDYFYNLAQFVSIYLIPSKLKIRLFNLLRNS